jgi:hypothetical protein
MKKILSKILTLSLVLTAFSMDAQVDAKNGGDRPVKISRVRVNTWDVGGDRYFENCLFDDNLSTFWHAKWSSSGSGHGAGEALADVDLGSEKIISEIRIHKRNSGGSHIRQVHVLTHPEIGNVFPNGETMSSYTAANVPQSQIDADFATTGWISVDPEITGLATSNTANQTVTILFNKPINVRYLRLAITCNNGSNVTYAQIAEFQMFGREECEACGEWDCEIEHIWCGICKIWDCEIDDHQWCTVCGKWNCGETHQPCDDCPVLLPSSYDPRIIFAPRIIPTSDQQGNNCWIHSSVATAELNYMKTFRDSTPLKFSENYYNYLKIRTRPEGGAGGFIEWNPHHAAGVGFNSAASTMFGIWTIMNYMVNWMGPVLEEEFPYSLSPEQQPIEKAYTKPQVHVQGYEMIPAVGAVGGPADHNTRIQWLKEAIFNNGAFALGYSGHSMSFVGWDDNRDGGSFLQKESAGGGPGEYKWHRYNTESGGLVFSRQPAYSVNHMEPNDNYLYNYFHTEVFSGIRRMLNANSPTLANVFTREIIDEERIDAVGFSTVHPNTKYEIYINPNNSTLNAASLVKVAEGTAVKPGFRTIRLSQQYQLNDTSTQFAVAVKYTLPSGVTTFDFDAQHRGAQQGPPPGNSLSYGINTGESFVNTTSNFGGTWTDMANGSYQSVLGGSGAGVNVPIRAYTNIGKGIIITNNLVPRTSHPEPLRAWISNDILHIDGLTIGETYRIFNIAGVLVHQGLATDTSTSLSVRNTVVERSRNARIFIIQSENKSVKIIY